MLDKGIYVLDNVGEKIYSLAREGEVITIAGCNIYFEGKLGEGRVINREFLKGNWAWRRKI